jgi:hypothetical protein
MTTYICSVKEGALLPDTSSTIDEFGVDVEFKGVAPARPELPIP